MYVVALTLLLSLASCRDIAFPPIAAIPGSQIPQVLNSPTEDFTKFAGLTTFANLPWVHCLSDGDVEPYDIAFLGAPFDTGTTARPGARFGPTGIRWGSRRISPPAGWSAYTHNNTFFDWARIVDCGDAPLTFLDNTVALKQLEKAHKRVSGRATNTTTPISHSHDSSTVANQAVESVRVFTPRIITLGGDHTTTLAALRSTVDHWGAVSVIHFDSHIDTWDPDVLGGGVSHYAGVNHGTFLHIAAEEGLITNHSLHVGIRAPVLNRKRDWKNDRKCGFEIVTARDIDRIGVEGVIERIKERVGTRRVYVSVDIDVLDPAFAPGTGTSEVGGWSTRELLSVLDGLAGLRIIGADVVEVAPVYDVSEVTALAAAEVALSLMGLMVEVPVESVHD